MAQNGGSDHVQHQNEVFAEPTAKMIVRGGRQKRRGFSGSCAVCGGTASGLHYRAPSCEGCKGFFRRTIQGNLQYQCHTGKESCHISESTRNNCQKCRLDKCLAVGMTPSVVLNERQRIAKRQMIQENRNIRRQSRAEQREPRDLLDETDSYVISTLNAAYSKLFTRKTFSPKPLHANLELLLPFTSLRLVDLLTGSINIVIEYVRHVPGFTMLSPRDGMLLVRSCCLEILCLRTALRYDTSTASFPLRQNYILNEEYSNSDPLLADVALPIFKFAKNLARLSLDQTEVSLLFGILALQASRSGLEEPERVEFYRDTLLTAGMHHSKVAHADDPRRWSTLLMTTISLESLVSSLENRILPNPVFATIHSVPMTMLQLFEEDV